MASHFSTDEVIHNMLLDDDSDWANSADEEGSISDDEPCLLDPLDLAQSDQDYIYSSQPSSDSNCPEESSSPRVSPPNSPSPISSPLLFLEHLSTLVHLLKKLDLLLP